MSESLLTLGDMGEVIPIIVIGMGGAITIVWLVFTNIRKALETRARETTRREIAAYVAEGSISPDDARKLLGSNSEEAERRISDAVAWGMISPKRAEELIRAFRSEPPSERPDRPAEA
ncbi:MAG: hypothetical protein R3B57_04500 [Phycisphaerales bacterium]